MKKRILSLLLVGVMSAAMFACGEKETEKDEHKHSAEVHLRIALSAHEGEAAYEAVEQFAREVEVRSEGKIRAVIQDSNKAGKTSDLLSSISKEESRVDIVIADVKELEAYETKLAITSLPFVITGYDDIKSYANSDIRMETEKDLSRKNMRVLAHYANGFHALISNKPIHEAKDMQNLRIGTASGSEGALAMKTLIASTMECSGSEVQSLLSQGACDGYEAKLKDIYDSRIYQAAKNLIVTNHSYSESCFVICEKVWSQLNDEYKTIVRAAAETSANKNNSLIEQEEKEYIDKIRSAGVRVEMPNYRTFWEKAESVVRGYASKYDNLTDKIIMWKQRQF